MMDVNEINRVLAAYVESQWITIKSLLDGTYQTIKAKDLQQWIKGDKLRQYEYFTFRSNNPYITLSSYNLITLCLDKPYLTKYLPYDGEVGKEYYEGINEGDTITIYYCNNWWEKCLNWKDVKAKRDKEKRENKDK